MLAVSAPAALFTAYHRTALLVQGIAAFTNNDLSARLNVLVNNASLSAEAMDALPESITALLSETGILAMAGLGLLAWLVTPALSLGMNHWTLDRIRGAEEPVSTVFSRLGIFFKSIGLRLLISLKVLLWMLPGIAVIVLSMVLLLRADVSSQEAIVSAANTSLMLIWAGMIAMLVLGVMGYLYYAQADFILADEPEERVLSCTRRSKEMMTGRRSQLLGLLLSFALWYLLVIFGSSAIAVMAGDIIGIMLQMLGSLFLSVYMLASEGIFYEALRTAPVQAPAGDAGESTGQSE